MQIPLSCILSRQYKARISRLEGFATCRQFTVFRGLDPRSFETNIGIYGVKIDIYDECLLLAYPLFIRVRSG